jgi:hypothetical protein
MAVTITSVRGVGGSPPSHIRVTGTVSDCEIIAVDSSCTQGGPVPVPISSGAQTTWQVDLPNDLKCQCGDPITVTAYCQLGKPSSATVGPLALPCEQCPTITIDPPLVSMTCVNGMRTVTFTYHVAQAAGQSAVLQWDFGDGTPTMAFVVTGPTPVGGAQTQHDYQAPTSGVSNFTATLSVVLPADCPASSVAVAIPACPVQCPTILDLTFSETPCDPQGNRQVTATAVLQGGPAGQYWWQWNSGQSQQGVAPNPAVSPPATFAGGTTHTAHLTIITGSCFMQFSKSYTVGPCPGTTTTTTTSTTTTSTTTTSTTQPPTTPPGTTTTTTTTATTSSTTSRPPTGGGCLCTLLLVLAVALIGLAAIAFLSWACAGFISPATLAVATTAAVLGLALLVIWILLCRFCAAIVFLRNTFMALSSAMLVLAAVLALLGLVTCAVGALINAAFFAAVAAVIFAFGRAVRCL